MSYRRITKLIMILMATIAIGCGGDPETPPPTGGDTGAAELIPLALGNKWVWETTSVDATGQVTGSRIDSILIVDDTVIANETWYSNQFNIFNLNRSDGYWVSIQPESGNLLYKYPASVSDWYLYGITNPDEFHIMIMSLDDTVIIPPDTFTCYKYRRYRLGGGLVDTTYHYIEPGTGQTRTTIYDGLGRLTTRQKLIRFSLTEANSGRGDLY